MDGPTWFPFIRQQGPSTWEAIVVGGAAGGFSLVVPQRDSRHFRTRESTENPRETDPGGIWSTSCVREDRTPTLQHPLVSRETTPQPRENSLGAFLKTHSGRSVVLVLFSAVQLPGVSRLISHLYQGLPQLFDLRRKIVSVRPVKFFEFFGSLLSFA